MEKVKISVIVPTYNRLSLLKRQVDALMHQTLPTKAYELLIVNDGSSDGTGAYLNDLAMRAPNVHVFHTCNGGPARARNTALKAASGSIIAFTDDDCEVHEDWLATILKELNEEVVGLQGLTYTDRTRVTPLTHQIDNDHGENSIPTCNAAYRKETLLAIGGFDETFPYPHNEDADVGWQMQEKGEVRFCRTMKVYHPPRKDSFKKVAKRMRILESEFTLYQKNPDLYRKYRDSNPLKHIYSRVLVKAMWYYTYSRLKFWNRPKLLVQGYALIVWWIIDLLASYPRYQLIYRKLR